MLAGLTAQAAAAASWDDVVRLLNEFQRLQPCPAPEYGDSAEPEAAAAVAAVLGIDAPQPAWRELPKGSPRRAGPALEGAVTAGALRAQRCMREMQWAPSNA